MLWHIGAILTCLGGYWFWFFLRVDVSAEAHPWYRIIKADLFVLALLAETVSPLAMQYFIIAMVLLIAVGTIIQMLHHKHLTYFFNNAKIAQLAATKELGIGEHTSIIANTTFVDIGTTSEIG